ncbi:MAG: cation transporter [Spirochaetes bacterium]|nr:cation transporter [Spirochaetota bacterium]
MNEKAKVARLSIISNITLIILKLTAGIMSGAVSIISEAIHSAMDLLAAVIAFFSVRVSDNPPDETHPYGHGKFENVSGFIEAGLILAASAWIIYEAVMKIIHHEAIKFAIAGVIVMSISALVNTLVSRALYRMAKKTNSMALEADALHLKADVITSAGVAVGLLIIMITKMHFLDPIIAIAVALFITREAVSLLIKAVVPLLDTGFSRNDLVRLEDIIRNTGYEYHKLRTRHAGNRSFVDMHLLFPPEATIDQAHDVTDRLKEAIHLDFPNTDVTIHMEPNGAHFRT